ncbi:G-patch domain and KOW motifs-containing protein-like, partial [Tigriopus californicus]|uniref:G-patch domain and KOW motifs-containing protein-like n=1 Tax=Tigriopus californicus TaxID=6832 RepID=UPI0027DAA57E
RGPEGHPQWFLFEFQIRPKQPDALPSPAAHPTESPTLLTEADHPPSDDLSSVAAREILAETRAWHQARAEGGAEAQSQNKLAIPLASSSEGLREQESTLDDYESVPVQGFGLGMLRGMGFKAGEGIGGFNKADIKCIEPVMRPKGLGLGASRPKKAQVPAGESVEDTALVLQKAARVQIVSGAQKDRYGQVEGMDDDAARVFVRLAVGQKIVSVSENAIRLVDKHEFKKFAKVINKDMYTEFKAQQEARQVAWDQGRSDRDQNRKRRSRSRSKSPPSKSSRPAKNTKSSASPAQTHTSQHWVRPFLRVRFIDEGYQKGRFFNTKVVIDDVVTLDNCTCRTDEGKLLEGIHPRQLETLIPKKDHALVMIVNGINRGQMGEMLQRDKRSAIAVVQILPDKDQVLKLDFDDICEYVGEVMEY